jgi:phage shock protein A
MKIMARILRIWKADIHGFMDRFEDQDLLLRQSLREMENCLQQKETRIQQLGERARNLEADLKAREQEMSTLENDLAMALGKQKDTIARLLIRRQIVQQKQCEHVQRQHETLKDRQKQCSELLEQQRLRYEILKVKAGSFLQASEQNMAHERFGLFNETSGVCSVDEDEIEIELIRRKEQFADKGATQ